MPFLPTLVTVALLAAASVFCPKPQAPDPAPAARMLPVSGEPSLALTEPAIPAAMPAARPPAVIAFSDIFPLTADPVTTSALPPAPVRAAGAVPVQRPARRIASAKARPCPGRHCQDATQQENPFAPAKPGMDQPTTAEAGPAPSEPSGGPSAVPAALPFAETVAEAVMPVAREVGAGIGARVERITDGAGAWVRDGRAVVKGSVAALSDGLL